MIKSFLMLGQSNMAGRGFILQFIMKEYRCYVMEDGK